MTTIPTLALAEERIRELYAVAARADAAARASQHGPGRWRRLARRAHIGVRDWLRRGQLGPARSCCT